MWASSVLYALLPPDLSVCPGVFLLILGVVQSTIYPCLRCLIAQLYGLFFPLVSSDRRCENQGVPPPGQDEEEDSINLYSPGTSAVYRKTVLRTH